MILILRKMCGVRDGFHFISRVCVIKTIEQETSLG